MFVFVRFSHVRTATSRCALVAEPSRPLVYVVVFGYPAFGCIDSKREDQLSEILLIQVAMDSPLAGLQCIIVEKSEE